MSATIEQRDVKHDEHLKKSASLDREVSSPKGSLNKSDSNGADSNQSRDGTPVDQHRRSPSNDTKKAAAALVQLHNASNPATPPLSKQQSQSSQSPKTKPSTPVSTGPKRTDSIDEINDKFDSVSISSPKHQQKSIDSKSVDSKPKNNSREDIFASNLKQGGGFRIDREYLTEHDNEHVEELEMWQPDNDIPFEQHSEVQHRSGSGWTPAEMFHANDALGVQSSYVGIDEYCTATPVGDEEAIRRAHQIASEIERSKDSQRAAFLENDDNEQDLDKETRFDDREGGSRGQKRQSTGGYQNKDNRRSQFNSSGSGAGSSSGRNHSNYYPSAGSSGQSMNAGFNRYGSNNSAQSRQQQPRASYSSNYTAPSVPNRQTTAPTSTSWRTDSPQQTGNNYNKPTANSPSLHSEERRQSASPANSKYSTDSNNTNSSVRRTNSVQNRQQQIDYAPKSDYQQMDRRVPDNQYHDESSSSSSIHPQTTSPQIEIQPLITPIPKQDTTSQPQHGQSQHGQYDQNQYESFPNQQQQNKDESNKKFTFNPNAPVFVPSSASFVPKAPTPNRPTHTPNQTPSIMPMQIGIPQQSQQVPLMASQHQIPPQQIIGMSNVAQYNNPQMIHPLFTQQGMQPNQMVYPISIPQQQSRAYQQIDASYVDNGKLLEAQQQKYINQFQRTGMQVQYIQQQPQYASNQHTQMIQPQMVPHPQLTGPVSYSANPTPYQNAPIMQQQQVIYSYNNYPNGQ